MFETIKPKKEEETVLGLREKLREAEERIRQLEENRHIDALTGLRNNPEFYLDKLINELKIHPSQNLNSIVVVNMDLNGFKQINDVYGHKEGDNALLLFADKLQSLVKSRTDMIFRSHARGDEFIVILLVNKDITEEETIKIFQRLHGGVSNLSMTIDNKEKTVVKISASVGYAVLDKSAKDLGTISVSDLMHKADQNMYEAKKAMKQPAA